MKKQLVLTLILIFAFLLTEAQTDKEYIDFVKSAVKLEVKSYIYNALELSNEETTKFDPLFNRYLKQSGKISLKKITLFDQYFNDYDTMSNEQLDVLNKELLKTEIHKSKINEKYYKIFKKALGVNKTTTFFFLTKTIDNLVESSRLKALTY